MSISSITTVPAPSWTLFVIFILSIIVEFVPKTQHSFVFTKPAITTLGDKNECDPIIESCAILKDIFK